MNANATIEWLNERDPINQWSVDDDVFCLHCDGVFKAQDVARDFEGDPTCPVCMSSTPLDFSEIPWWRHDLVDAAPDEKEMNHYWRVEPIEAVAGRPGHLPARNAGS